MKGRDDKDKLEWVAGQVVLVLCSCLVEGRAGWDEDRAEADGSLRIYISRPRPLGSTRPRFPQNRQPHRSSPTLSITFLPPTTRPSQRSHLTLLLAPTAQPANRPSARALPRPLLPIGQLRSSSPFLASHADNDLSLPVTRPRCTTTKPSPSSQPPDGHAEWGSPDVNDPHFQVPAPASEACMIRTEQPIARFLTDFPTSNK